MGNFICNDCGAEISPQWKSCLNKNECPGCSGKIMSEFEQELIVELGEAMKQMPNDPIGVAGWIVSNFKLQKVGECEPIEKFHDKSNKKTAQPNNSIQLPQDKISTFFKNAGYDLNKIKEAEKAKSKVLNGGDITGTDLEDEEYFEDDSIYNDETMSAVDEINSILSSKDKNDTAKARAFLEQKIIKQKEIQNNISNGVGAVSRNGSPAGFRRV